MKKINKIIIHSLATFFCLLLTISSFAQEKESTDIHKTRSSAIIGGVKYYLHTVEKGQTLFAIAKFYSRDVNDIVIENPEAIDGIKPGQILRIPIEKKKASVLTANDTSNYILHKVEPGQTIYAISKHFGVSDEKLRAMNPELKEGLKVGQMLKIPSFKAKPETTAVKEVVIANSTKTIDPTTTVNTTEAADHITSTTKTYAGEKKEQYDIAFFLPFLSDEANELDVEKIIKGETQFSNKTSVALQFYEGVLLAIDSLKKEKVNARVFIYDIDDKDSLGIAALLKKPELVSMDLIVGPLYGTGFFPVAKFAKENNIPIVSPFTQINKILFSNPYVCKLSPSGTLQIEQMSHFVVDSFATQNIILVNSNNPKELAYYNTFKNTTNEGLLKAGVAAADSVKIGLGLGGVQNLLNANKVNVVVLPSNNQSYVSDFISKLNILKEKYNIVLFGLPGWMNYDNLDFEYLNNLSVHIPSNNYIDYESLNAKQFIKSYREKYKTEPELFAFQGFDAALYFLNSLHKNGTGFLNNVLETKYQGLQTNYHFSQYPSDSGFENKFVFILKYQDYKLVKAN